MDKNTRIVIVGGGLAGFAVGIALLQKGYVNVTVHERDSTMDCRRQGYGLTILQGVSALKWLGVFDTVKYLDTPSRSHFIFHSNGSIIGFFGTLFWPTPESNHVTNKKYNLHIGRQQLRAILMDQYIKLHPLSNEGIHWNSRLTNIVDGHCAVFQDGHKVDAGLIIGCDGINSAVRKFKYPNDSSKLGYLGIMVVLGITGCEHMLGKERVFQTVDGCTRLFVMPYSKDSPSESVMWQLSFPIAEEEAFKLNQSMLLLKQHVQERCCKWHTPIPQMIDSTSVNLLMGIPAYDRDPTQPPDEHSCQSIALLGDAAHPMSPFKGQGANQALLDAVLLAESLSKQPNLTDSISYYDRAMISRVHPKVMQSRERVQTLHQPNVLSTTNFECRGVDEKLLEILNLKGINALYSNDKVTIEEAIKTEMLLLQKNNTTTPALVN
ncbi:unnamed protein product [Didymodactylos carnosus]|uniref:FAD-binding domain-containing protein n=1 Tax=Didymodactylos carnosus TaxID=1234261 RepID=A0A815D484_9BILA|nr:unnamed protein product [Didymodactylos carnosus]CAF1292230.1 unnamed protein product [Didymodactylos carnosus]CAF3870625.1 unnamed protein product [Didymodactylos carnosus]CAF4100105.1 unnamed protein product [Didymodactylos carnosus]